MSVLVAYVCPHAKARVVVCRRIVALVTSFPFESLVDSSNIGEDEFPYFLKVMTTLEISFPTCFQLFLSVCIQRQQQQR